MRIVLVCCAVSSYMSTVTSPNFERFLRLQASCALIFTKIETLRKRYSVFPKPVKIVDFLKHDTSTISFTPLTFIKFYLKCFCRDPPEHDF